MGKSARSSAIKKNNQKLKSRVFGPVEAARNERLSAKLMDLATQPKPPRAEMEVENDGMPLRALQATLFSEDKNTDQVNHTDQKESTSEAKEDQHEGASPSLSIPIPASIFACQAGNNAQLPTPPATPPAENSNTSPLLDTTSQKRLAQEMYFYHVLGVSAEIEGFDENGFLRLAFANPKNDTGE